MPVLDRTFDVFFPVHAKDYEVFLDALHVNAAHIRGARRIYVTASDQNALLLELNARRIDDELLARLHFTPECEFPFSLDDVAALVDRRWSAGWYYQQLLKLYVFDVLPCCADRVLVVDADVMFLKPLDFVDARGRAWLAHDEAVYRPYREWMHRLLPGLIADNSVSGVTDHMLFERDIVARLRADVEAAHGGRTPFWRLFLALADRNVMNAVSEFDLYYAYARHRYAHRVLTRRVASSREHAFADGWDDWKDACRAPVAAHERKRGLLMLSFHGWRRPPR